jgi:hypothetical protein
MSGSYVVSGLSRTLGVHMNTKSIVVSATLVACVSFAAVRISAQKAPPAAGFAFSFDGLAGFRVPIEAKVVKGAPFSADIINESIQTLSDGNRIVQRSNTRIYRDSEGRVRREEDRPSPAISITDPVNGMSFTLDPENHVAWQTPNMVSVMNFRTLHTGPAEMEKLKVETEKLKALDASRLAEIQRKIEEAVRPGGTVQNEQVKVEQLPARDIEAVRVEGTRRTTTIAAGAIGNELPIEIVSEEWTSPDLKILVMTERRDPRLGTSTYRVVNIIRAEPDRYLFEVPSDYTVKESGLIRKVAPRK